METLNKLITTLGDPILVGSVIYFVWRFVFKDKKPLNAVYVVVGGGIIYYIMHNTTSVLQSLGTLAKAVIDFFVNLVS